MKIDRIVTINIKNNDIESVRRIFKKEIDSKNIIIIERLKAKKISKKSIRNYLIPGGTLDRSAIDDLIESDKLSETIKISKDRFRKLQLEWSAESTLSDFEIALEKTIISEKLGLFNRSVLSIGVVLGFLLLKEEELNNLRKIAKAKEFNIPEDEVKRMLVVA